MNAGLEGMSAILQLDMLLRIALQLLLFSASAFFSASETALFSLSQFDLQRLSRTRSPVANLLHQLLEQPRRLIVSILCGNELVNIAAAANMTGILATLFGVEAAAWAATFVMIPLILLLGEVTPKTLAVTNPIWASTRIVARPLAGWVRIVAPLAFFVRLIADKTTTLLVGPERAKESILRIEELQTLIDEGIETGEISATERSLVHALISAGATEVREIMTPRSEVTFIDGSLPATQIRSQFAALRRTRVPVFLKNRDNVQGFLYVEDFLIENTEAERADASHPPLHPPLAVAPSQQVDAMLDFFEEQAARAALVVDEFGSVDGIVTLADVTRFLFAGLFEGSIPEDSGIVAIANGYEMDGSVSVSVIRRTTGLDIRDSLMTTIAGVALRRFGRFPDVGDRVEFDGLRIEVLAIDGLRISRIRLTQANQRSPEKTEATS